MRKRGIQGTIQLNLEDASHTTWTSRQTFLDWTHSDAFRRAHGGAGMSEGVLLGHPRFRGWESVDLT